MEDEEETTGDLLRLAGGRPAAPADLTARVREKVRQEWRARYRRHRIPRAVAIATTVLAAAAIVLLIVRTNAPRNAARVPHLTVATGERVEGAPLLRRKVDGRDEAVRVSPSTSIRAEDVIETPADSRVALRATDGSSVRLDRDSRIRFSSSKSIELVHGAVYIATGDGSSGFEVRTPMGTVRDAGTQFEIRLQDASLRVRVRTGTVEIRRSSELVGARAGSETTVTSNRIDTRSLRTYGPEWEWTGGLAPTFDIEGRSLSAFLDHITREQGWTLRYSSPTLSDEASRIVLHGSIEGLRPEDGLGVALATSGLQYRLRDGELLVYRPGEAR